MPKDISGTRNFKVFLFLTVSWLLCTIWEFSPLSSCAYQTTFSVSLSLSYFSAPLAGADTLVQHYCLLLFSSFSWMFQLDLPWYWKTFCYQLYCFPQSCFLWMFPVLNQGLFMYVGLHIWRIYLLPVGIFASAQTVWSFLVPTSPNMGQELCGGKWQWLQGGCCLRGRGASTSSSVHRMCLALWFILWECFKMEICCFA